MPDSTPEAVRLARQRIDDQIEAARREGAQAERVNGRLLKLEDHAGAVNGQIKALTGEVKQANMSITSLRLELAPLIQAVEKEDERNTATWQKWAWVIGFLTGIAIVVLTLIQTINGPHG